MSQIYYRRQRKFGREDERKGKKEEGREVAGEGEREKGKEGGRKGGIKQGRKQSCSKFTSSAPPGKYPVLLSPDFPKFRFKMKLN